jgi:hypothetical protein
MGGSIDLCRKGVEERKSHPVGVGALFAPAGAGAQPNAAKGIEKPAIADQLE